MKQKKKETLIRREKKIKEGRKVPCIIELGNHRSAAKRPSKMA